MINRKKIRSWLSILLLAGLGISVSPHRFLTRTSEVSGVLSPVLSNYEVIQIEPGEIERQVRTTGELRFRFQESDFYFNLEPHDMRAPNYRAVEVGPGGVRRDLSPQPVHTFKGVLAEQEDVQGRFNLTDGGVEGVVYAPEGWVYVEPLRNYLPSAPAGELVVYEQTDVKPGGEFKCGVSLPKRVQRGVNRVEAQVHGATHTSYVVDVATEADYEYVRALGGSIQANREIEGILNLVDGVYRNELLLRLQIGFQNTWDTPNDPYTATNVFDLLDEFEAYWNSNYAAELDYDLAHLWTGTDHDVPRGVAYRSVVCAVRSKSYGLSKHNHAGKPMLAKYITAAHEIGHNLGATHPFRAGNAYHPSEGACSTSIMWPGTVQGSGLTFCRLSREEIEEYVSGNNHCLTREPLLLEPPTHLRISRSSFSPTTFARVDLTWRDNSAVEAGFIVERRRVGWSQWSGLERTGANVTAFSNTGLFPGITYIYRVRAFNEGALSAYSNEVEATAASGPRTQEDWIIDTVAGSGRGRPHHRYPGNFVGSYGGDGGPAIEADLNYPRGVAVDGSGNLYIADTSNHRIRRVDATGIISTIAGTGQRTEVEIHIGAWLGEYGGDGGPAVEAHLNYPTAVAVDGSGNLYIADAWNHLVRRVDAAGTISTVAGSGTGTGRDRYYNQGGYSGDGGPAVEARLNGPWGVAVDGSGNLYIADTGNGRIRRVDATGIITTVAGNGAGNHSGDGGPAVEASLRGAVRVAVDGLGNLYIADAGDNRVRRVDPRGIITTVAGGGRGRFSRQPGPAKIAVLNNPSGLAADGLGNLFISDTWNNHIRRIDSMGIISTVAGTLNPLGYPEEDFSGDGGPAIRAGLGYPRGVAVSNSGTVYFADRWNHRIRALARPPQAATRLTATAVSSSRIDLAWRHNSANLEGFRVERRVAGRAVWSEIGMTAANAHRFTDMGLKQTTNYEYRVRAFNVVQSSVFSNVARATTLEALAPALTRFTPMQGPVGTRVTLTGTNLFEATSIEFNKISAPDFEILSGSRIEVTVPDGATSGPISVVAPGGEAVSADPFTVTTGIRSRLFVPIVLRALGRTPGSFFTSELTLTNRGTTTAAIRYTYRAAFGGGSGTAVDSLEASRQRVIPDAIAYLTSLGVPIGSGSAGGTLSIDFSNLSSLSAAAVTVRVSTPVEEGSGRAGLAFPGLNPDGLLTGPAFITGLRQNRQDRSNLAVQNAGIGDEESITLRVTVYSGDPEAPGSRALPDLSLPPGGFHQYNRILTEAGFDNGYAKVERVEGAAPYYAYGVINDNFNSDGSFVFPAREDSLVGSRGQTLPVIIETKDFTSELTVTNFSPAPKTVDFHFVAEAVVTDEDTARFSMRLEAGEQRILSGVVDWMREQKVPGIGAADEAFVGAVFATVAEGDMSGIVMGARTGSPDARGGQYSLFYNGVPNGAATIESAWIYGLQQNEENRSNLALVNTGELDGSEITLEIDIYDGEGDSQPRTRSVVLGPRRWHQLNGILAGTSQGYVEVRKTLGDNPFIAYGVINDGGKRGQRSGDGAFLPSQ